MPVEAASPEALRPKNVAGSVYKAHVKLRLGKLTKPPEQFGILPSMGTAGLLGMLSQYDELVHRNFRDTSHEAERIERIGGEALASHPAIAVRRRACYQCPIGCTRETELVDASGAVVGRGEGPEFETVAMFGANLDIYDLEPITEANYLCNRLGLDTISAGGTHRGADGDLRHRAGEAGGGAHRRRTGADGGRRGVRARLRRRQRRAGRTAIGSRRPSATRARSSRWCARWRAAKAGSAARWRRARGASPNATATPSRRWP